MPRVKLSAELKEALSDLSHKEKDKLLFRLLPANSKLVDRLIFDLLELGETQESRREEMEAVIEQELREASNYFYSPGILLLTLRELSGKITRHVQATKDKYGEVSLNLLMLVRSLELNGNKVAAVSHRKARTFTDYTVKRTLKLLKLIAKMHPDMHLDFQEDLEQLGKYFGANDHLMRTSIHHGLDVNWLLNGEVPEF